MPPNAKKIRKKDVFKALTEELMDNKKLAVIHIVKKELGLTDTEYRDILQKAAGVYSAKDLDDKSFQKLMNYFVRTRHYKNFADGITLRQKIFIKNLAQKLAWDMNHLNRFTKKYYQQQTIDQLSRKEASKLIESLKHIRQHNNEGKIEAS